MRRRLAATAITMTTMFGATCLATSPVTPASGAPPSAPEPVAARPSATFESLKLGASGERVRLVQQQLVAHGASIAVDGQFGPKTRAAVRAFQKAKKLRVDGVVGPVTWRALGLEEASVVTIPEGSYTHPNPNVERWHDDALAAGWSDDQWKKLSCIIQRESKGIPTAKNPRSSAMGLLQIMWSVHSKWIGGSSSQLYDGPTNLELGRRLYERSGGWKPWASTSRPC